MTNYQTSGTIEAAWMAVNGAKLISTHLDGLTVWYDFQAPEELIQEYDAQAASLRAFVKRYEDLKYLAGTAKRTLIPRPATLAR